MFQSFNDYIKRLYTYGPFTPDEPYVTCQDEGYDSMHYFDGSFMYVAPK
jgi:hypothetical protein